MTASQQENENYKTDHPARLPAIKLILKETS